MNVTEIPFCFPGNHLWLKCLYFVLFIPSCTFLLSIIYTVYEGKLFILIVTIFSKLLWFFTLALQIFFKSERPFPECVPWFMSKYGIPSQEIVYVSSAITCVIMYSTIFQKMRKRRRNSNLTIQLERKSPDVLLTLKLFWGLNIFLLWLIIFFFLVIFPLTYWLFYLNTLKQVIFSQIFGIVLSLLFCVMFRYLIHENVPSYFDQYLMNSSRLFH